jgi:hypothetical protein
MKKIFWLIIWLTPIVAFSQEKATFSFDNTLLTEVLFSLEKTYNIRFSYSDKIVKNKQISISKKKYTLAEMILKIEEKSNIQFEQINLRYYIIKERKIYLNTTQHLNQVTINNYLTRGIVKNKKSYFTINPTNLDILPGLIEADVLESIQQLPGVVSPNETATGLIVRGGSSDQNRILWDGINIYHNGHLFGMISAFNPNIAKKINFHNKGTNPRFGERISSVIDIRTNKNILNKTHATFSVNGINTDFVLETPLIKNKLSIQLSTRRSYTEIIQTPTFDNLATKVFQNTKILNSKNTNNNFFFVDYNTKINYQLNKYNFFSFSGIFINNQLDYLVENKENTESINDVLKIKNEGYALNWNKTFNSKIKQISSLTFSKYFLNYNLIERNTTRQLSNFDKHNAVFDTNFITETEIKTAKNNKINFGYQYNFKDVRYAFINSKEVELLLDNNKERVGTHAFFSNYSYKNSKLFDFDAGFRINYYKEFDKIKFEPRLIALKKITNQIKIQATGEIKNQIISQIDETVLSDLSLENRLWHLADNKRFPITNSKQISLGLLYKNKSWSADLDYYHKYINGKTALSLGFLNPDGKTYHIGNQKIKGLDFYLKKYWKNINTWISYSYTDVQSRFNQLNNEEYFTSNTSITHVISTSIAYKLKQFQIALGWKWRTGKPYTKSIIKNENIRFVGINTERLSNYHRLDFSTTYQFNLAKSNNLKGKIGLSIRNVYNQKNHLSKEYYGYNNIDDPIRIQDKYSLGFTPNFLFKIYW